MAYDFSSHGVDFADMMLQDKYRKMLQHEGLKDKLINDPTFIDKDLAHLARPFMTEQVAKKMPVGASFEKAMSGIDKEDPRRAMLAKLQTDIPDMIRRSRYGEDPGAVIMKAVQDRHAAAKEDTYKFIQSRSGFFDKSVAGPADAEDYAAWERKNPGWSSPITNALIGAGGQLASIPVLAQAGRMALSSPKIAGGLRLLGGALAMAPPIGPVGIGAKIVGAGLMGITAFGAMDAVRKAAAAGGHEMGLLEELAVGVPIFGGLNVLAKAGGKAVSRGIAGLESNLATETNRGFNTFTRTASGRLVPNAAVTGEDIRATGAAMADREALNLARDAKMESFRKLEPADHDAILKGANPEEVMNARVKFNMEQDTKNSLANKELLENRIIAKAKMIQENEGLEYGDALAKAKGLLAPSALEVIRTRKILRDNGIPESVIDSMNHEQRLFNVGIMAEKKGSFEQMLPAVKDEVFPPAVTPNKIKSSPLDIKTGLPIHLGTEEAKQITGFATANVPGVSPAFTKTAEQSATQRASALAKLREARKGVKGGEFVEELEGNEAIIKDTKLNNRVNAFNLGAGRILSTLFNDSTKISEALSGKAKFDALNIAAKTASDELEKHIYLSGFAGTPREQLLRKGYSSIASRFKGFEDTALEDLAQVSKTDFVSGMLPEGSVGTREAMESNKQILNKFKKEGTTAFAKIFGTKPGEKVPDERIKEALTNPDLGQKLSDWHSKYSHYFLGAGGIVAATAGLVSFDSLFASKADAAVFSRPGAMIPVALKEIIEASGKPVEEMTAKVVAAGLGPPKISENGHAVEWLMRSPGFAPKNADVFSRSSTSRLDSILSPGTRDEMHMNARYEDGTRAPFGIGKDVGYRSQVILANTEASLNVVKTILKDAGIESSLDDIATHMKPLTDKYHKQSLENSYWSGKVDMLDQVLGGKYTSKANQDRYLFSKTMRNAKGELKNLSDPEDIAAYNSIYAEKQEALAKVKALKPSMDEFAVEHEMYAKSAAEKWATARVAFAADGTGMAKGNNWLEGLLAPSEIRAAEEITTLNRLYAARMKETGHDVISANYIHHPAHPSVDYTADLSHLESFAPDGPEAMRLVNFFSRSAGSKLMIPDTHYIMGKYLPDANKRIEISDMWKMGRPGGWDDIRKQMQARGGHDGALRLINDVRTAFDPMDIGGSAKWLNRYSAFEVARLLTLSPSVSFKHALKLMGNWSIFPSSTMIEATGQGAGLAVKQAAEDMAGTAFRGKDNVVDLSRALTSLHHTYAAVSDMAPYELPVSAIDKFLTVWNKGGSVAVNGVERLDRGITFAAAMRMAHKQGMTPEQAMFGLMDSVLKVNFLTGPNNPKWLKDPLIRTMMLFQGTPFKILEQRAMLAYQGGKDIGNTVKLLMQLRKDVKAGEENFMWHMLNDEFTRNKDVYGTPYSTQFMKQLVTIGTVVGTGKMAFDSDMWGHTIHIPGLQLGERGAQLGLNPAIGAAWKATTNKGAETNTPADEFWLSRFLNGWMGNTGFPAIAHKIARLKSDDIPAMYKDSKLSYLFGVPRSKEK